MSESINKKLKSILERSGIEIDSSIDILDSKSYHLFIDLKNEDIISQRNIRKFSLLNTIWKANIVFSRMIFKYSLFSENRILAEITNSVVHDKLEVVNILTNRMSQLETEPKSPKVLEKINTLKKVLNAQITASNFEALKFSEKNTIHKIISEKMNGNIFVNTKKIKIDKIRTLRNKAVHSNFIINYLVVGNKTSNIETLFSMIDPKYQNQFISEFQAIYIKYDLKDTFEWFY